MEEPVRSHEISGEPGKKAAGQRSHNEEEVPSAGWNLRRQLEEEEEGKFSRECCW